MFLLLACTDTRPPVDDTAPIDTDTDTDTVPWVETPAPTEWIGAIEVVEMPSWSYARLAAAIRTAALPTTQTIVATEGDCSVLDGPTANAWDCTPECSYSDETCIDGECVPWPDMAPAGDITVEGLLPGTAVLEAFDLGYYGTPDGYTGELFDAGDVVTVTSPGGDTPGLSLTAQGVDTIDLDYTTLESGEDMTLTWTPGSGGTRVEVQLETGWHGSAALTTIWCDTEDDGELVIPGSITGYFQRPSCGECEMSTARRYTRDIVDFGAGPIQLLVASEWIFVPWWAE